MFGPLGERTREREDTPTAFIGKAIAQLAHVAANRGPFSAADDANVLDAEDGEEEVLVGAVSPVFVHLDE